MTNEQINYTDGQSYLPDKVNENVISQVHRNIQKALPCINVMSFKIGERVRKYCYICHQKIRWWQAWEGMKNVSDPEIGRVLFYHIKCVEDGGAKKILLTP